MSGSGVGFLSPGPSLSRDRKRVLDLLGEFSSLFSGKLATLHKKEPYVLPLFPDLTPVTSRSYPIPPAYYKTTRKEVDRLIKLDVLTPDSSSPWGSPAFIIPKKDGSVRLVCDFRRPNKLLRRHFYPTRYVKEMLSSVDEPKYISLFDIPMSYYMRVIAVSSRGPTAIVLPWGKLVFNRLPTGVSTAPDKFQACMNETVGDMETVRTSLDDIMVTSQSFDEYLQHLRELFERLVDNGITLHPAMSKVCAKSAEYLGYQISKMDMW
ncbi:Pol Polyprotein [Phytophthora megakarya]|uniref:Pol Polyprotein n=1 Tax=Phytophthora megakarya TaxID=4795 RepID=A0A225VMH5_9STRA|nr:Pol Polyprotein [Phytophthora megakarya]